MVKFGRPILFILAICFALGAITTHLNIGLGLVAGVAAGDSAAAEVSADQATGASAGDATPEPSATVDPAARGGSYACQLPQTFDEEKLVVHIAESFQDDEASVFERWVRSTSSEFTGVWAVGGGKNAPLAGDKALLVTRKAHRYGIARKTQNVDLSSKPFVVQYEVRHEDGHTCGGAYLKLLTQPFGTEIPLEKLDNTSPYSIMFGPDKCGETNKVHFIIKTVNPKTGKSVEHHLRSPPTMPYTTGNTHLYTLVVDPTSEIYKVFVDKELKRSGSLREDFDPPIEPPKEIDDPEDKKPSDWVDEKMIPDPAATKPADWDENAPREIPDPNVTKPPGWLDDEPKLIPDPDAVKPAAWNDEEDGEWKPPMIPNPKCATAPGCGAWKPPMIPNPSYRGKWKAPLIPNPAYKGQWQPRKIPNPEYYRVEKIQLQPVTAVGIEIWTMDQGIAFDNILFLSGSEAAQVADEFAVQTWAKKVKVEKEREESRKPKATDDRNELGPLRMKLLDGVEVVLGKIESLVDVIDQFLARAGVQEPVHRMIELFQRQPMILAALIPPVIVSIMLVVSNALGRKRLSSRAAAAHRKKRDETEEDDQAAGAATSRSTSNDNATRPASTSQKESAPGKGSEEVMDADADDDADVSSSGAGSGTLRKRTSRTRKADE
jgi:calnexin